MKNFSFVGKIAALIAILVSAGTFSVKADDLVVDAKGFTKISASAALEVVYVQAPSYHVVARGEQRDLEYLDIRVTGHLLNIGRRSGLRRSGKITIEVMAPDVTDFSVSGASSFTLGSVEADELSLHCSGASHIKGQLKAKCVTIGCSGASSVKAEVDCDVVKMSCSGASKVDLKGRSGAVSGSCSGASHVNLNGSASTANVSTSGASSLNL